MSGQWAERQRDSVRSWLGWQWALAGLAWLSTVLADWESSCEGEPWAELSRELSTALLSNRPDNQHRATNTAEGWRGRIIQETPGDSLLSPRNLSAARPPTPPSGPAGASSQWPAATGPASRVSSPGRTATTAVGSQTQRPTMYGQVLSTKDSR